MSIPYLDKGSSNPKLPMNRTRKMHNGPIKTELFDGTLNGYQAAAQTTAIYPGKGTVMGLVYATLKGCGEAGEFSEKGRKATPR